MLHFNIIDFAYVAGTAAATYFLMRYFADVRLKNAASRAAEIVELARKESELEGRQKTTELELQLERKRAEFEKNCNRQAAELDELQRILDKQAREMRLERSSIKRRELELVERRQAVEQAQFEYRKRLEAVSGMSKFAAIDALKEEIRKECAEEVSLMKDEILGDSEEKLRGQAHEILVDTLQRFTVTTNTDLSATLVRLPNEEMKGRIIGREGRNIHSFEASTGTTLMIDETPGSVMISSFDPVRREVARIALERLVLDGRIHPAAIEEAVEEAEAEIKTSVLKIGEEAASELKIKNLDPEITILLGKLHFYLSNNQRTLEHSIETAYICSIMASEIGLNPEIAKRAGLFHDMGKAISHEYEGSHARAGALILKTHGELDEVVNAVEAHHDEVRPSSPYAPLLQVADMLSSTRPGARNETMDGYIQRIENLENLALSMDGVGDAYALRAGRELRVIVRPEKLTEGEASSLARKLRLAIEEQFTYPGNIKVTVIREQRFSETAT